MTLSEKSALVTGAASGIGRAIAVVFAEAGAHVFVADVDQEGAASTIESVHAAGGRAEFVRLDVTDVAACAQAAEEIISDIGWLDVLVNNAGIGHVGTIEHTTAEDLDRLYAVNVRGVFNLSKAFIPHMVSRKSGSVINMASIGGVVGIRDRVAYCATKFAVVGITKTMALDHARDGIRINCICPGRVETEFVRARLQEYPDPQAAYREMSETQAIGRMGTPDEIAHAALYLASDRSAFMTGSALIIDGGFSAGK